MAATRYLVGLGHRRIALLTADADMRPSRERIAGFREAFAEAGIDPAGAQLCIQSSPMDFAHGDTLALLRGKPRPTAIIALGTRILAGVLRAARDLGLSVPRDLSVLSVGDTDLAAVHTPAITALRWSLEDVGRAAAELLLQRLRGDGGRRSRAPCCRSISCCEVLRAAARHRLTPGGGSGISTPHMPDSSVPVSVHPSARAAPSRSFRIPTPARRR